MGIYRPLISLVFALLLQLEATQAFGGTRAQCVTEKLHLRGLKRAAVELVAAHEKFFEKFLKTSGYKPPDLGPTTQKIWRMVQHEEIDVAIEIPESIREDIARSGIQNQFQTGRSLNVATDPIARNIFEASYLDMRVRNYERLDPELKPKSGFLRPRSDFSFPLPITGYGEDQYILKLPQIRERLTLTQGDSSNRAKMQGLDRLLTTPVRTLWELLWGSIIGKALRPREWADLFVPWNRRTLIASWLEEQLRQREREGHQDFGKYTEAQVWGPIRLEDVEIFEFSRTPPSGDFLQSLLSHGIKIRDRRTWPPREWTPGMK